MPLINPFLREQVAIITNESGSEEIFVVLKTGEVVRQKHEDV